MYPSHVSINVGDFYFFNKNSGIDKVENRVKYP